MDSTPAPEAAPGASSSSSAAAAAAEDLAGGVAAMTLDERFDLLRGIGEECIQEDELRNLLEKKPVPICYDGFEPSGRMHIAQVRTSVSSPRLYGFISVVEKKC
jgi:tyrosyl-tRNA synthetase